MPLNKKNFYQQLNNDISPKKLTICLLICSGLIFILSCVGLLVNYFIYQYPGNNYFPTNIAQIGPFFFLFYLGSMLLFGKMHRITATGRELLYFFIVMCLIALATNSIQYTPFPSIDKQITAFESLFDIDMNSIVTWTNQHAHLYSILNIVYNTLPKQMSLIPLFIIITGRFTLIREYYLFLLFTALLGFSFYYFFPTIAPAGVIVSPWFKSYQLATSLKFQQIHAHIPPTTKEGGLIALPSFHCIWALMCVYLLKEWRIAWITLLLFNCALITACIALGWHYPIDIIAGIVVFALAYILLIWCRFESSCATNILTKYTP